MIKILQALNNEKHKTLLFLIYSSGLRVGEVTRLKIQDIDSKRMMLHIIQGKGKKDRYSVLSEIALIQLRKYYKLYKPEIWLSPGGKEGGHITERTVQRVFENALQKAGIKKDASVHTMRHSFATHLLEAGTDVYHIQKLMGHSTVKTTSVYIHLQRYDFLNIKSPLDLIAGNRNA